MESRFGNDFSDVRIHADKRAAASARALGAQAYTVGRTSCSEEAGSFLASLRDEDCKPTNSPMSCNRDSPLGNASPLPVPSFRLTRWLPGR
jgi:hypothetical protein